jgi:lipoyl(octanoyl) transferase
MKAFTASRTPDTEDEIWLLQHPPVYTQGLSGKPEHVLDPGEVPIIQIDRGGQVTYHGPGQWVAYVLYDLRRANVNVRQLVNLLEAALVQVLGEWGIEAYGDPDARGVYVDGCKIAALGLKGQQRVQLSRPCHSTSIWISALFAASIPAVTRGLEVTSLRNAHGVRLPRHG